MCSVGGWRAKEVGPCGLGRWRCSAEVAEVVGRVAERRMGGGEEDGHRQRDERERVRENERGVKKKKKKEQCFIILT